MTQTQTTATSTGTATASARAEALAQRLEQGCEALAAFAGTLTEAQWRMPVPIDGRTVGVVVHHVASVLPLEVQLAQQLGSGQPITGVTWAAVHEMNAGHAKENANVTKQAAVDLLRTNAAAAAAAIRMISDAELDSAATNSLYADAPLTCQHMLEDHAVRHSYHHLAKVRGALS
jgi:hypothetical protein